MASFNGDNLFASGTATFDVGSWRVAARQDGFPGLDGAHQLVLGARGRRIRQWGLLKHATVSGLQAQLESIADYQKSAAPYTLEDNYGATYPNTVMTHFKRGTLRRSGTGYIAQYEIEYLQLSEG